MQKQQDDELLAVFHLMDGEEREFYLELGRMQTTGRSKKKPELRLIHGSASPLSGLVGSILG
jgi:hypothetical protein